MCFIFLKFRISKSESGERSVDVATILDVAALPRELIQVTGVNFIKLLLQKHI